MKRKRVFSESLHSWIAVNRIFGYFPYILDSKKCLIKSKYWIFLVTFNFLIRMGLEIFYATYFKAELRYFGFIFKSLDFAFIVMWAILAGIDNGKLPELITSFNRFDNSFRKFSYKNLPFIEPSQVSMNQYVTVGIVVEFLYFLYAISQKRQSAFDGIIITVVRTLLRWDIYSFMYLNYHLMTSLNVRFDALRSSWYEMIENKIHRPSMHAELVNKIDDYKLLYFNLLHILDNFNTCMGSRLANMYAQFFYYELMYLYVVFSSAVPRTIGMPMTPIYPIIATVLVTKRLTDSTCFSCVILRLPAKVLSNRLLLQVYGFLQQLHLQPAQIKAAGFFNVDQALLNSTYMAFASYSVAIFQLTPMIVRIGEQTSYGIL